MDGAEIFLDIGEVGQFAGSADLALYRDALGRAHDMPVGPGWRIEVDLRPGEPITWELPAPAVSAFVIDPEAGRSGRANQVWGERPPVTPDDVAQVSLSDDGLRLSIEPGPRGDGVIGVIFAEPTAPAGTVRQGDKELSAIGSSQVLRVRDGRTQLVARRGTVCQPPPGEAARIHALQSADDDALELLEALGYIGGGE